MKKLIILSLFMSTAYAAQFEIISYQEDMGLTMGYSNQMVNITKNIKTMYCYTGHAKDACNEIDRFFDGPLFNPADGAHERVKNTCSVLASSDERYPEIVQNIIVATDDYGNQKTLEQTIERCSSAPLMKLK